MGLREPHVVLGNEPGLLMCLKPYNFSRAFSMYFVRKHIDGYQRVIDWKEFESGYGDQLHDGGQNLDFW